jgi:phosphoribosylglycinamide formyltransferase-1
LHRLAIFLSGSGSNARNLISHFAGSTHVRIVMLASNRPGSGANAIGGEYGIPVFPVTRENMADGTLLQVLLHHGVDFVVLAGFLRKVPADITSHFRNKIVNIHPSLLPRHGGKGMYGSHVHEAVVSAGDTETGITIHFVNEHYDQGDIIFQARVAVAPGEHPGEVEQKVRALEKKYFPAVVEKLLT